MFCLNSWFLKTCSACCVFVFLACKLQDSAFNFTQVWPVCKYLNLNTSKHLKIHILVENSCRTFWTHNWSLQFEYIMCAGLFFRAILGLPFVVSSWTSTCSSRALSRELDQCQSELFMIVQPTRKQKFCCWAVEIQHQSRSTKTLPNLANSKEMFLLDHAVCTHENK